MKILVGYAGSTQGDQNTIDVAKKHATAFNASLIIVSSMESVTDKNMDDMVQIENHLAYIKETMAKEGIACETHILVRGMTPGEDLVEYAIDKKIDEIIIGIEKKSKVGKLLFGSNAQYIILNAPCPVLCVK
ncbi:MAG: universal stress protein [Deltaproteobacteria bacterium]|nr:universal stress protein [Deltaproteobacteria bacterium]